MVNQPIKISIVICTYNRGQILKDTLASFSEMELPTDESMELVIIDNRSTDTTKEIAEEFVSRYSGYARYIFEWIPKSDCWEV